MGLRENEERKKKMQVMNLTVSELKEMLEDYEADGKGNMKVRVAVQPSYPMAAYVAAVTRVGDTLYIAASDQDEYITGKAWGDDDIDEEDDENEE